MSIKAQYLRLSGADGDLGKDGKDESNSIENQRALIADFLENREEFKGCETREYVDDGYTGSNFKRPAFERMIDDVKKGIVDTIIVKDLSRFGRDYIGVGEYLEEIFPLFGIRFIAINDRYDSNNYIGTTMGIEMVVSNLVNSMYSRDAGKKLYSADKVKWEKGYSTTGRLPFGYKPDPNCKGRYVIDPEAAKIVRRIFDLALQGYDTGMIADRMNEEGHLIPSEYNRIHKIGSKTISSRLNPDLIWDRSKVWRLLTAEEYTGAMIMGKRKKIHGRPRQVPRSEWFITEGANEAIVTREEYEQAQLVIRQQAKAEGYAINQYPLMGKVRCGNCRRTMGYLYQAYDEIVWCRIGAEKLKHSHCSKEKYIYTRIESAVFHDLKYHIALVKSLGGQVKERQEIYRKAERKAKKKQERVEIKVNALKAEKMRMYENYADGRVGIEEYKAEKERLDKEIEKLMEKAVVSLPPRVDENSDFPEAERQADIFGNAEKLTKEMADAFIESVYVHEEYRLEIVYRFADCLAEVQESLENTAAEYEKMA
ncbi:MAG: recombinase family protein [Clostridiales bacterium]|nr:recombinase family protein [Clostridiales bacterium]